MKREWYFIHEDDEFCVSKLGVLAYMKENNLKEMRVFLAVKDTSLKEEFIFCKNAGEFAERKDCNMANCEYYTPTKSGRGVCKDREYCIYCGGNTVIFKMRKNGSILKTK